MSRRVVTTHYGNMYCTFGLVLCCALTIATASPLAEEHVTKSTDVKLNTMKTELKDNLIAQEKSIQILIKKVYNLAIQTGNDVIKLLSELEVKWADQLNTQQNGREEEKPIEATTKANVNKSSIDGVVSSKSNNTETDVTCKQETDSAGSKEENNWWDAICQDPAKDAQNWDKQAKVELDEYDTRLRNITGCKTVTLPTFQSQMHELSAVSPELRLAVRTLGPYGGINIIVYLDGVKDFALIINQRNQLDFYSYPTSNRLWRVSHVTPVEGREHYWPIHFKFVEDGLAWRAGCGNHSRYGIVNHLSIKQGAKITVDVQSQQYPTKLLLNCPPKIVISGGLSECDPLAMEERLLRCAKGSNIRLDISLEDQDCSNIAFGLKCVLKQAALLKACGKVDESNLLARSTKSRLEPVLRTEKCKNYVN